MLDQGRRGPARPDLLCDPWSALDGHRVPTHGMTPLMQRPARILSYRASGNRTVNSVRPGTDSTVISPSCCLISRLTMSRPSPVP